MNALLTKLFAFLLPIIKKAAAQAVAEELAKAATPKRRPRSYMPYDRVRASYDIPRQRRTEKPGFHDVLMVAFDISGPNAVLAQQWLMEKLPECGLDEMSDVNLDSWWVANDERYDRSDCDSAVFVRKGDQDAARALLRAHGLVD